MPPLIACAMEIAASGSMTFLLPLAASVWPLNRATARGLYIGIGQVLPWNTLGQFRFNPPIEHPVD
jgi:hypothetical protein